MGKNSQIFLANLTTPVQVTSSENTHSLSSTSPTNVQIENRDSNRTSEDSRIFNSYFSVDGRYVVSEWMYQVCEQVYKTRQDSRRVFQTSVHILDRVLMNTQSPILLSEAFLQLTGLSSVVLAMAHLHNAEIVKNKPPTDKMLAFCGSKFTLSQFSSVLAEMQKLNPLDGLQTAIDVFETQNFSPDAILNLALVLSDSYILDYSTTKHHPQTVAECAYLVSQKLINKDHSPVPPNFPHKQCFDEMFYIAYILFKDKSQENCSS